MNMINDMTELMNDVSSLRNNYRRVRDEDLGIRPRVSRDRTGAIRSTGLNLIDPSSYTVQRAR
jgi:hypothetical protein